MGARKTLVWARQIEAWGPAERTKTAPRGSQVGNVGRQVGLGTVRGPARTRQVVLDGVKVALKWRFKAM